MKKKFKLEWINVPGVEFGYKEIWNQEDIRYDFGSDKSIMKFTKKSKKGNAYIIFDHSGQGFLIITRVSNNTNITT
tara:strand:- start:8243 stop:8470 length:228 start_codon:yes stop_codon:yes gene_type:complete